MASETVDGLSAARASLISAELLQTPAECYLVCHLAALKVAAELLARRARPSGNPRLRALWPLVAQVAPEFAEWAGFFGALQAKRQAVAAGATAIVSQREADDLLRDVWAFHDAVRAGLGTGPQAREVG